MVVSARPLAAVAAPTSVSSSWPWHTALVGSVRVSLLQSSQRRMEAETYLTDGYGVRLAIEAKPSGWVRFGEIAKSWMPSRIKLIIVSQEDGTPYLNTSQVFDVRPRARKWLALGKTAEGDARLVKQGQILVMRSATVGRAIVATSSHENAVISDHFLRVEPFDSTMRGWVYAFLRSPQAISMIKGSQYASVIRHIEPHHLASLPIPNVSNETAAEFQTKVDEIVSCRNNAARLRDAAEKAFADAVGPVVNLDKEEGFTIRLSSFVTGRRRLEAAYHTPRVRAIIQSFKKWERLGDITERVWWPNRFKRLYGDSGTPYMSADDVFTTNPYALKSVLVEGKKDIDEFGVEPNWIVMARSGQTYGLNGSATLVTEYHKRFFLSDDMIRIRPKEGARAGYLLTALTHPSLGRPLLIREAYGMSIPHLDPGDVAEFPVARLGQEIENKIADFAETAALEQAKAEMLERRLSEDAGKIVSEFLLRPIPSAEDSADAEIVKRRLSEIELHPENLVSGMALRVRLDRIKP